MAVRTEQLNQQDNNDPRRSGLDLIQLEPVYLNSGNIGSLLKKWEERGSLPRKFRGFYQKDGIKQEATEISIPYYDFSRSDIKPEDIIDLVKSVQADNVAVILNIGPKFSAQPLYDAKRVEEETGGPVLCVAVELEEAYSKIFTQELPPNNSSAFYFKIDALDLTEIKIDEVSIIEPGNTYFYPEFLKLSWRLTNPGGQIRLVTFYNDPMQYVADDLKPHSQVYSISPEEYIQRFGKLQSQIMDYGINFNVIIITVPNRSKLLSSEVL